MKLTDDQLIWLERLTSAAEMVADESDPTKAYEMADDLTGKGFTMDKELLSGVALAARWAQGRNKHGDPYFYSARVVDLAKAIETTPQFARILPLMDRLMDLLIE